jgi:hypothetical protein
MATESKRCPNEVRLFGYFEGTLGLRARKRMQRHFIYQSVSKDR